MSNGISRRNFAIGTAAIVSAGVIAEQIVTSGVARAILRPFSALYSYFFVDMLRHTAGQVMVGVAGNFTYDRLKQIYSSLIFSPLDGTKSETSGEKIDYNEIIRAAKEQKMNIGAAATMADALGAKAALQLINDRIIMFSQVNNVFDGSLPINAFSYRVSNKTPNVIGGNVTFQIFDVATGNAEDETFSTGVLTIPQQSEREILFPIRHNFSAPGQKIIKVIDKPNNIEVDSVNVVVLPISINT